MEMWKSQNEIPTFPQPLTKLFARGTYKHGEIGGFGMRTKIDAVLSALTDLSVDVSSQAMLN
jgi:hypothetical protein